METACHIYKIIMKRDFKESLTTSCSTNTQGKINFCHDSGNGKDLYKF